MDPFTQAAVYMAKDTALSRIGYLPSESLEVRKGLLGSYVVRVPAELDFKEFTVQLGMKLRQLNFDPFFDGYSSETFSSDGQELHTNTPLIQVYKCRYRGLDPMFGQYGPRIPLWESVQNIRAQKIKFISHHDAVDAALDGGVFERMCEEVAQELSGSNEAQAA